MKEKTEFARHFREVQPKFSRLCMRSLANSGLTMPQYALLNLLANEPEPMKDLSARMLITKPAVTNLVDRLEKRGFLKRVPDAHDRRVTLIAICPKGAKLVREMQGTVLGFLLHTLSQFSSAERGIITRFYQMLSKNFDQNLLKKKANKVLALVLAGILLAGSSNVFAMARRPGKNPEYSAAMGVSGPSVSDKLNFENFIRLSLLRSEVIKQSREEIAIARARTFQAMGEAIGDGDFVITHNFQEKQAETASGGTAVENTSNAAHRRTRYFAFSQPLFQGFKSLGAILGAGSYKSQRSEEYEWTKETLFIEAAEAYYALLAAENDLEILNETGKLFSERINDLNEREKIGRSRIGEVAQARAKMKVVEAQAARARGTLLSAQSLATFYTGVPHPKVENEDPETFSERFDLRSENYAALAAQRADVNAARQAVKVAKQTIVVKQSSFWPTLSLDANHYEKRQGFQSGITWDALLTFDVPLYRGGDNLGQLLEAKSNYNKAQLQYQLTSKQALLEIEQAHQNWIAARAEHVAYQDAVKAEEENLKYQKEDYGHNLVNNLDVLTALEEFLSTRQDANAVEYDMKTNYWKLQIAISSRVPEWAEKKAEQKEVVL